MPLPPEHHVVRTCTKKSQIDRQTNKPQPAAFEFRFKDENWQEAYLSVNWLEFLEPNGEIPAKIEMLRQFQARNEHALPMMKLEKWQVYAALNVGVVRAGTAEFEGIKVELECEHEPKEGFEAVDPHSGVVPTPGVATWPTDENAKNAPEHLAIQQFLYASMCHFEPVGETG